MVEKHSVLDVDNFQIMKTQAIETVVGILQGRNALYLDEAKQTFSPPLIAFKGVLSAPRCSNYQGAERFPIYEASFADCRYFTCVEIDRYKNEKYLTSSFDLVLNSDLLESLKLSGSHQHYIFATYDFIYEIVATNFTLTVAQ